MKFFKFFLPKIQFLVLYQAGGFLPKGFSRDVLAGEGLLWSAHMYRVDSIIPSATMQSSDRGTYKLL